MKFVLEIELGNDAMQTYEQIGTCLARVAARDFIDCNTPAIRNAGYGVRDGNGNLVGTWRIEGEAP